MDIHQIYIGEDSISSIISRFGAEIRSFAKTPGVRHKLWTNEEIVSFLENHYPPRVLNAYNKLIPPAYKCDLARVAIINFFGGWYSDIGTTILDRQMLFTDSDYILFNDSDDPEFVSLIANRSSVNCGLFYSKGRSSWLETIINTIVDNVENDFYGDSPWDVTGPIVFADAAISNNLKIAGEVLMNNSGKNEYWIDGLKVAKYKDRDDQTKYFESPKISYIALWRNRAIYV